MQIPLLDLKAQYQSIKDEIDEVLSKVVESQYFILSEEVDELEKEIASYAGTLYGAGVASGTDALILSLKAAGIGEGDKVITSPFTFFATAEAVSLVGAEPVFVDIDEETYNIDPDKIEETLRDTRHETRDTIKAILPVHIYGQCADMTRIMKIADKYGLKVIEDSAQAIGATHNGRAAGSFGMTGCFSFFPSKNLGGFGDGGMIVSQDADVIARIKKLRVHGSKEQYIHDEIGYNSRLDSIQAAILRVKLKMLDEWLEGRRRVASRYNEAFEGLDIITPKVEAGNVHTYHQYTIAVNERDAMLKYLNDKGIAARIYYPVPLHLQPCYEGLDLPAGSFSVAENMAKKVLSLPVYPELSEEKIAYIIETIKEFVK